MVHREVIQSINDNMASYAGSITARGPYFPLFAAKVYELEVVNRGTSKAKRKRVGAKICILGDGSSPTVTDMQFGPLRFTPEGLEVRARQGNFPDAEKLNTEGRRIFIPREKFPK